MTSESTRFLGQPNETKPTVGAVGREEVLTFRLYREMVFEVWNAEPEAAAGSIAQQKPLWSRLDPHGGVKSCTVENRSVLEYEAASADVADVGSRVAFDQHQVGELSRFD
jgi:hypothetical protein